MRFVHIADVHLDAPFASRSPSVRSRLRAATREAFQGAVELALQERVHGFLIAGDLFHSERISFETERLVLGQLARLTDAGIAVVYATGNHDPAPSDSRLSGMAWPEGVTLVSGPEAVRVHLGGASGRVVGSVTAAGHESTRETRDLSLGFPAPEPGLPNVAVLHTQVAGAADEGSHVPYAPSVLGTLERAGYDYWALGHVHLRQSLSEVCPIHYPGNPQGRTPREDGPKGCLLVDLSSPGDRGVSFHPLGPVRWVRLALDDLDECTGLDAIVDHVAAAWEAWGKRDRGSVPPESVILHLILTGACPIWQTLMNDDERRGLAEAVTARLGLCWTDIFPPRVGPVIDVAEHAGRPDVLGEVLRLVRAVAQGEEQPAELEGLDLALPVFRELRDPAAYLRELVADGEHEVVSRMVRGAGSGGGP